jgi:hypothetical protein
MTFHRNAFRRFRSPTPLPLSYGVLIHMTQGEGVKGGGMFEVMRLRRSVPLSRSVVLFVFAISGAACGTITDPMGWAERLPDGAVEIMRPEFPAIWARVSECSGIRADMGTVRFYVAPEMPDARLWGLHQPTKHRVIFPTFLFREDDRYPIYSDSIRAEMVGHEMLHAHLNVIGQHGHPDYIMHGHCERFLDARNWHDLGR